MTQLVLSTGNVVAAGPSIRKRGTNRSNLELVNSLRGNFVSAQQDYAPATTNGDATPPKSAPIDSWTERQTVNNDDDILFIPRIDWRGAGLREEANQYEITVKLFLLPHTSVEERERYAADALNLVRRELGIKKIDLLVVAFPGISFEGDCEWKADQLNAQQGDLKEELRTWSVLEELHRQGAVERLGVAEFGSEKLDAFVRSTTVPPSVNQVNLKECCNVPPPLKEVAEAHGVKLNTHTDCTDILPHGTLRELLGQGPNGAGVLADADSTEGPGLKGEILPQWVVRYLAFVRDRGVIENKGYFAGAKLDEK